MSERAYVIQLFDRATDELLVHLPTKDEPTCRAILDELIYNRSTLALVVEPLPNADDHADD